MTFDEFTQINIDGSDYLAIKLDDNSNTIKKNINLIKNNGYLLNPNGITKWHFTGIKSENETDYLYFPKFSGESLKKITSQTPEKALDHIIKLIDLLKNLENNNIYLKKIDTDAIFFLDDSSVLFFPPEITELIRLHQDEKEKIDYFSINYPYNLNYNEKISYSILVLLYKSITGHFPFEGIHEEEIYSKIRLLNPIEPSKYNPEINKEISSNISNLFKKEGFKSLTPQNWKELLIKWKKNGSLKNISNNSTKVKNENINKLKLQKEEQFQKKIFMEKYKKTVLIILAITVGIGLFSYFLLSNIFKPKSTLGLNPLQVAEHYYKSLNILDNTGMSDCVSNDAGKYDINEVISLFINQKMLKANEYKETLILIGDWEKKGKPKIEENKFIYGIGNLILTIPENGNATIIDAVYEKWEPFYQDETNNQRKISNKIYFTKDRLYLKKDKKYWVINKLERLSRGELKTVK